MGCTSTIYEVDCILRAFLQLYSRYNTIPKASNYEPRKVAKNRAVTRLYEIITLNIFALEQKCPSKSLN